MQVFDASGVQRDWAWLASKYKCKLLTAPTTSAFRLVRVDETIGPAVFVVDVRNAANGPQAGQPVAFHWPGVEDDDKAVDLRVGGVKSVWFDRALVQYTAAGGDTGFGFGGGSVIHDTGPHTLWVLSPSLPSDALTGVGWLGGTDHACPGRLTFRIIEGNVDPDPDPTPTPSGREAFRQALIVAQASGTRAPYSIIERADAILKAAGY